jgi:mono/diheme cytochrome c family protein
MRRRIPARMALLACSVAVIPQTVAAASDAREPAQIFASTCGWCHHKGGREAGKGPRLMGTSLSDAEIAYRIRKGRQGYMPAFEGAFSDAEMNALVAYIRNLRP